MFQPLSAVELLGRIRAGDVIAIHEFYGQVEPFLRNLARQCLNADLRRTMDSNDLAHSAFRRILAGSMRARFEDESRALSWIATIVRNRVRSLARRSDLRDVSIEVLPESPQASRGPAEMAEDAEEVERFRAAMEHLSSRERRIVALRDFEELSYAEVARRLEPPSTAEAVRKAHDRAIESLRLSFGAARDGG